jgi:3-keto-5-aminohexanoate cleavage enzyme
MVNQLPEGSTWQVVTVGKYHLRSTMIAMALGGNARTGMEDTVYYRRGELVESNALLVERLVRIAREIGREPATVDEAKVILGLKRRPLDEDAILCIAHEHWIGSN